jgi:hypothetical protein
MLASGIRSGAAGKPPASIIEVEAPYGESWGVEAHSLDGERMRSWASPLRHR